MSFKIYECERFVHPETFVEESLYNIWSFYKGAWIILSEKNDEYSVENCGYDSAKFNHICIMNESLGFKRINISKVIDPKYLMYLLLSDIL